ncbi:hypothetical protein CYY_008726, partial [Polysphondylium violaceum]
MDDDEIANVDEKIPPSKIIDVIKNSKTGESWIINMTTYGKDHGWVAERLPSLLKATRCLDEKILVALEEQLVDEELDDLEWEEVKEIILKIFGTDKRKITPETIADSLIEFAKSYNSRNQSLDSEWAKRAVLDIANKICRYRIPGADDAEKLANIKKWNDTLCSGIICALAPDIIVEKVRKIAMKASKDIEGSGGNLADQIKNSVEIKQKLEDAKSLPKSTLTKRRTETNEDGQRKKPYTAPKVKLADAVYNQRSHYKLCFKCGSHEHKSTTCTNNIVYDMVDPPELIKEKYGNLSNYQLVTDLKSQSYINVKNDNEIIHVHENILLFNQTSQNEKMKTLIEDYDYYEDNPRITELPTQDLNKQSKIMSSNELEKTLMNDEIELDTLISKINKSIDMIDKSKRNEKDTFEISWCKTDNKIKTVLLNSVYLHNDYTLPTISGKLTKTDSLKYNLTIHEEHKDDDQKIVIDIGSNISLINRKLLKDPLLGIEKNDITIRVKYPLLKKEEEIIQFVTIQINDYRYRFYITDINNIEILIGNNVNKHATIDMLTKYILNGKEYNINNNKADTTIKITEESAMNIKTLINNNNGDDDSNMQLPDMDFDLEEEINKVLMDVPEGILNIMNGKKLDDEKANILRNWTLETFDDVIVDDLNYDDKAIHETPRAKFKHSIELKKGAKYMPKKPILYYKTEELKRVVEEKMSQFLKLGIIRKSTSNHSSPIMLIFKNNKWRIVHDFRELNKVTERDIFPFTPADQTLNLCKNSNFFSKFDMLMGYFQMEMEEKSIELTAFTTHIGKFEYLRMPQGLVNAPSTFARMMADIFGKVKNLLQYFDDLLVHNKDDIIEHVESVIRILLLCRHNAIFISREKAELFKSDIEFLGYHISKDGLSPRRAKVKAILEIPKPRNGEEGLAFLGVIGFYRRTIDNFAEKTINLTKECRKGNKNSLSVEAIKEFEAIKKEFEEDKIVALPIEQNKQIKVDVENLKESSSLPITSTNNLFEGAYHLFCDASNLAISGVLYQIQGNSLKPIWFHSRKLNSAQRNYTIGDRELLAIFDSLHKFKNLLYTKDVAVYTDHRNLQFIIKKGELTMRQANHIRYLDEFNIELLNIPGEANKIADLLSRKYDNIQWDETFLEKIKKEQEGSKWLRELERNDNVEIITIHGIKYLVEDKATKLIIINKETIDTILEEYHDAVYSGHRGFDITFDNIRRDYYFREMGPLIMKYIKSCVICQSNKSEKKSGFLHSLEIPDEIWKDIS